MGEYETKNICLACFLRVRGYKMLDLKRWGGKIHFVMEDKESRAQDVKDYYNDAAVPALSYSKALTDLRSMVYDWKPTEEKRV